MDKKQIVDFANKIKGHTSAVLYVPQIYVIYGQ